MQRYTLFLGFLLLLCTYATAHRPLIGEVQSGAQRRKLVGVEGFRLKPVPVDDAKQESDEPEVSSTGGKLAQQALTVRMDKQFSGRPLEPKVMGGYRSEEKWYWKQIYDPDRTLKPLNMATNRFQIALHDEELGPDGSFLDPDGTQKGIMAAIAESVSSDVFVTVGFPWSARAQEYISQGFSPGWESYWNKTFTTVAAALAGTHHPGSGRQLWVEIFGEPDLDLWWWVYGTDQNRIHRAIQLAYSALAPHRSKFKLGGCGFAFPEGAWASRFLDFYRTSDMKWDFFSYHHYLGWADSTNPSGYPFPDQPDMLNLRWRNNAFRQMLQAKGLGSIQVVVSEYAWQDGDLAASAGFTDPAKSARTTMTRWQSCARTLQAIDIILQEPSIARAYWAQGVGNVATPDQGREAGLQYLYSYDPAVTYNQYTGTWNYKASYYAFWMYGKMGGTRLEVELPDPALGVWASKEVIKGPSGALQQTLWVAIWNRDVAPRRAALALPGVPQGSRCAFYRVDESTFKLSSEGLEAVISGPTSATPPLDESVGTVGQALALLQSEPLQGEAAIFLHIEFLAT